MKKHSFLVAFLSVALTFALFTPSAEAGGRRHGGKGYNCGYYGGGYRYGYCAPRNYYRRGYCAPYGYYRPRIVLPIPVVRIGFGYGGGGYCY